MDYDFSIFEKLKEIFSAARKVVWWSVGGFGAVTFGAWALVDWAIARALQLIAWLKAQLPEIDVNPGNVTGLEWSRVEQFVPVSEAFRLGKLYFALLCAVILMRMIKKMIPFG